MARIDITLPAIIRVDDYHEFLYLQGFYKALNKKIKVIELGSDTNTGNYIGLVYFNKKPSDSEIYDMTKKYNFQ